MATASRAPWPPAVRDIRYRSAADGTDQPALFYTSGSAAPRPLLVALHTWSGDYRQPASVPYAAWCIARDWRLIHPDFRGPNNRPEATGSALVTGDIASATDYAVAHAAVDPARVYLVGASGGGHAALLTAARVPHLWAGVSAWVPIADLAAWHAECRARGLRYADDLVASCGGAPDDGPAVAAQYRRRSPLGVLAAARGVPLDINAGIRDGHTGSVPVAHSLRAFNALAAPADRFAEADIRAVTANAAIPPAFRGADPDPAYGDQRPLFRRRSGAARVTLFDGGHEIIFAAALGWLARQRKG